MIENNEKMHQSAVTLYPAEGFLFSSRADEFRQVEMGASAAGRARSSRTSINHADN